MRGAFLSGVHEIQPAERTRIAAIVEVERTFGPVQAAEVAERVVVEHIDDVQAGQNLEAVVVAEANRSYDAQVENEQAFIRHL